VKSPVYAAERRSQTHTLQTNRSGTLWIWVAALMLGPALLTALGLVVAAVLGVNLDDLLQADPEGVWFRLTNAASTLLLAMNIAQGLVVGMVSMALAVESVRREQRQQTWDLLLLTGQTARAIARGKIFASFRTLRGDFWSVVILRLGLMAGAFALNRPYEATPDVVYLLFLLGLTVAWSLIDTFIGIGCAVGAGATSIAKRPLWGMALVVVRVVVVLAGVVWMLTVFGAWLSGSPALMLGMAALGMGVLGLVAYLSVLAAEGCMRAAGAGGRLSQTISQPRTSFSRKP
jgi:hypothetical protein